MNRIREKICDSVRFLTWDPIYNKYSNEVCNEIVNVLYMKVILISDQRLFISRQIRGN